MAAGGNGDGVGSHDARNTNHEQCAEDAALVARLEEANFTGPVYDAFRKRLAAIGFVVMMGQIATGEIFAACAALRRPLYPRAAELHQLSISPDDRAALAGDAAMRGLELFCRRGVEGGQWTADKGATLVTYFVNACVRCFPQVYRAWRRERDRDDQCHGYGTDPSVAPILRDRHAPGLRPATFVELVEELTEMPPTVRYVVIQMMFHGRTHAEIAQDLGTTAAAIGEQMRRYRKRHSAEQQEAR